MHTQLSHSVAQQHADDLRADAARRRLAKQVSSEQPVLAAALMRRTRRAARIAGRRLAVLVSVDPRFTGLV